MCLLLQFFTHHFARQLQMLGNLAMGSGSLVSTGYHQAATMDRANSQKDWGILRANIWFFVGIIAVKTPEIQQMGWDCQYDRSPCYTMAFGGCVRDGIIPQFVFLPDLKCGLVSAPTTDAVERFLFLSIETKTLTKSHDPFL